MDKKTLLKIKSIERNAYPLEMQQLQDCTSWEDVAEYCEVPLNDLLVYTEANMYILIGEHRSFIEVVDMASVGRFNIFKALNFIASSAKGRTIKLDAREGTSYPLILKLRKKIEIIRDEAWQWGEDVMHEMEVRIIK